MRDTYDEIASLVSEFCGEHLDSEYEALCLRLLEKLCRKRPSPLLAGKPETWAAGVVYAICANNYIFSKDNPFHMAADDIAADFNLAASTAGNKASQIRKMFDIHPMNSEWLRSDLAEENPALWMLKVDGFIVDFRLMPIEIQSLAFHKGLIPFVPADRIEGFVTV
ncbi:MAG: DUF6398 domain-containing protein [Betaproteobacteria bacterium]|nr:DUF6398 domain-containing protein [Betaproteobacteria bacterium]